jgi:DNA-binding transcriptional LysR family regulator
MKWVVRMEFHQLRYFVAAAEELSVTAAARRLRVSQPALSRQIALLEGELGVALFDRIRKRIHLTEAGRFFLPKARQILCDAETGAQQVREQYGSARRTIRLGFLTPFLDDVVTPAVKAMRKEGAKVHVALFELSPRAQLDRLRDDELDIAILGNVGEEDRGRFTTRVLARSRMGAVLPDEHLLAARRQVALKELAGEGFVSLSDALFPGRRQFLRGICQSQGFEPRIVEESDSIPMLLGAVSGGAGVALLPLHSRKLPHAGCVFVPMRSPVVHAEVMAVFKGDGRNEPLAGLLGHLGQAAGAIADR